MGYSTITVTDDDGVRVIAMNRPEVMNALNAQMRRDLTEALIAAGTQARCVVLTGVGRAFCSGQDLSDTPEGGALDFQAVLRGEYEPMLAAITDCPVPTIAAVNGAAAGAGANLALAADVVIATEGASFIQAFTRIGLMPDAGGTFWLPRQVGMARAMGAMLFAEKIPARQAADWGMIWEAVADDAFDAHWRARAAQLASGPTLAYRAVKTALRTGWSRDLEAQLAHEAAGQGGCGQSGDFREGVSAFLEKRSPVFRGS